MKTRDDLIEDYVRAIVLDHPDGMKRHEIVDEVLDRLADDEQDHPEVIPARSVLVEEYVTSRVTVVMDRNRRRLTSSKGYLKLVLDAARGDTVLGLDDPILDTAMPIGDGETTVRSLRYWTEDDVMMTDDSVETNRKQANQSADENRVVCDGLYAEFQSHGAKNFEGLL